MKTSEERGLGEHLGKQSRDNMLSMLNKNSKLITPNVLGEALYYAGAGTIDLLLEHPEAKNISDAHIDNALSSLMRKPDPDKRSKIMDFAESNNKPIASDRLGEALADADAKQTARLFALAAKNSEPIDRFYLTDGLIGADEDKTRMILDYALKNGVGTDRESVLDAALGANNQGSLSVMLTHQETKEYAESYWPVLPAAKMKIFLDTASAHSIPISEDALVKAWDVALKVEELNGNADRKELLLSHPATKDQILELGVEQFKRHVTKAAETVIQAQSAVDNGRLASPPSRFK